MAFDLSFGELSVEQFLKEYWQQKPLVIRQGLENFSSPITADELAGLACEEQVHSRIVIEKGGDKPWQLIEGPMDEAIFASLPETHWTLLVNDVEKHFPELIDVVDAFRFIPEWRIDDLMISFAPEGGTVGPHLDQYDVFILQAQGHRRWQINTQASDDSNQLDGVDLKIQKNFLAEQEWLLAPGDIIYIPPGVSHYGVATDDCLSFSIGYRAPTHAEMLESFIAHITSHLPLDSVYKDNNLIPQNASNEITNSAIENVREIFKEYLNPNHPALADWFGRFVTESKTDLDFEIETPLQSYQSLLENYPVIKRNPASRFAYQEKDNKTVLFVDGERLEVKHDFAKTVCETRYLNLETANFNHQEQEVILNFFNRGILIFS